MATAEIAPAAGIEALLVDPVPVSGDAPAVKSKVPKEKKASTVKKPALHPPYLEMIYEAIASLKERTGSSQYAISKFVEEKHKAYLPANFKKLLLVQLRKLTAAGKLSKVKNSYKISAKPTATAKPKSVAAKPKSAVGKLKRAVKAKSTVGKPKSAAAKPKKAAVKVKSTAVKPKSGAAKLKKTAVKAKSTAVKLKKTAVKPNHKSAAGKPKAKPAAPKPKTVAKLKTVAPKPKAAGRPAKAAKTAVKRLLK